MKRIVDRIIMYVLAALMALALPACSVINPSQEVIDHVDNVREAVSDQNIPKYVGVTCASFAAGLDVASANLHKLSAEQVKDINDAAVKAQSVCGSVHRPTLGSVGQVVLNEAYSVLLKYGFYSPK